MRSLLVLFVAVAFFATFGEALKCYECLPSSKGCGPDFKKDADGVDERECGGTTNACLKGVVELTNGTSYFSRGCLTNSGKASSRAGVEIAYSATYFCTEDLCNGVSTTSAALSTLIVLVVPLVFANFH